MITCATNFWKKAYMTSHIMYSPKLNKDNKGSPFDKYDFMMYVLSTISVYYFRMNQFDSSYEKNIFEEKAPSLLRSYENIINDYDEIPSTTFIGFKKNQYMEFKQTMNYDVEKGCGSFDVNVIFDYDKFGCEINFFHNGIYIDSLKSLFERGYSYDFLGSEENVLIYQSPCGITQKPDSSMYFYGNDDEYYCILIVNDSYVNIFNDVESSNMAIGFTITKK